MTDQVNILEVLRLCTDGTANACSFLYAAAAKAGRDLGYLAIQTFILAEEPGTSLTAAGWVKLGESDGGDWNGEVRTGRRQDQPQGPKHKYGKVLRELNTDSWQHPAPKKKPLQLLELALA